MKKLVLLLLPFLVFISCGKELETVTVNSDAKDLLDTPTDTVFNAPETASDDFIQVRLGEIAAVESLDPLFASSNSEYRVIHLIYEGLVSLNSFGSPVAGLAKSWEVNDDSTRFTFNLRTNVNFHDSPAFESGNGRRFKASDVSYIFKRMAVSQVPDFAADHFSDIRGFTAYHNEQTFVKDPSKRVLTSIEGIMVQNDSTVVFQMKKSAPDFLEHLAHPMASIYPKEAVSSDHSPIQKATGTGRFIFIKKEGNAHLLTTNKNYRGFTPAISRLDIVSGLSEKDVYQEFARGNLDALVELGSSTLLSIADSTGSLLDSFSQDYNLEEMAAKSTYSFYFNPESGQGNLLNEFLNTASTEEFLDTPALGMVSVSMVDSSSTSKENARQFIISHSKHPFERYLLDNLANEATQLNFTVSMNASYAISEDITFTTRPYPGTKKFLSWKTPLYILSNNRVSGLKIDHEPWNLNLVSIKVSGTN